MRACNVCGVEEAARAAGYSPGAIVDEAMCFTCNHWKRLTNQTVYVIKGRAHVVGNGLGKNRGYGGRTFRLRLMSDLSLVTTNDLNSVGLVPPEWRHRFPDNATFEWSKK